MINSLISTFKKISSKKIIYHIKQNIEAILCILLEISTCKVTQFIAHTQNNKRKYCPNNDSIAPKSSYPIVVCRTIGYRKHGSIV